MMVARSYIECRVPNISLIIVVAELSGILLEIDAMRCDTIHSMIANRAGAKTILKLAAYIRVRILFQHKSLVGSLGCRLAFSAFLFIVGYHGSKFTLPL
jgi:hypothetical protein